MRALFLSLFSLLMTHTSVFAADHLVEQVVEGDAHHRSELNVGRYIGMVQLADADDVFRTWLTVCLDLEKGDALRAACVAELRTLTPQPSVLVSGFHVAGAMVPANDGPWMFAVGERVPVAIARSLLRVVRTFHSGPLVLRGWNDEDSIISIGPVPEGASPPVDEATFARLNNALTDDAFRAALGTRLAEKSSTVPTASSPKIAITTLVDFDLRSNDGKSPIAATILHHDGVLWTPEGLFLPGKIHFRYPPKVRPQDELAPAPNRPYQAEIVLPDMSDRNITITMLICQASNGLGQDNLFTLGHLSRWLSAQVNGTGELLVGLDNRWQMLAAQDENKKALTLNVHTWHAVTIGSGDDGQVIRMVVDGHPAKDVTPTTGKEGRPPRRINEPGESLFSFVDPGNPRHFHGLVRRLIVHHGLLDHSAIATLHSEMKPSDIPAPTIAAFALPLTGTPPVEKPLVTIPEGANDF
jgi:hypothetical protein